MTTADRLRALIERADHPDCTHEDETLRDVLRASAEKIAAVLDADDVFRAVEALDRALAAALKEEK